jgi:hypothetical protein
MISQHIMFTGYPNLISAKLSCVFLTILGAPFSIEIYAPSPTPSIQPACNAPERDQRNEESALSMSLRCISESLFLHRKKLFRRKTALLKLIRLLLTALNHRKLESTI